MVLEDGGVVRYWLAKTVDCERVAQLGYPNIVDAFKEAGNGWENVTAVVLREQMLYLYPNSSDAERKIREKQSEIRTTLELSEGCGARWDQYLVEALTFDFDQEKLPNPDQHKEKWSEVNGAEIVKAYWKSGRLILSMASQEAALAICRMDTVSLEVSSLVVPPRGAGTQTKIGSDHLSLPTLSFVISAHGYPQCGACSFPSPYQGPSLARRLPVHVSSRSSYAQPSRQEMPISKQELHDAPTMVSFLVAALYSLLLRRLASTVTSKIS